MTTPEGTSLGIGRCEKCGDIPCRCPIRLPASTGDVRQPAIDLFLQLGFQLSDDNDCHRWPSSPVGMIDDALGIAFERGVEYGLQKRNDLLVEQARDAALEEAAKNFDRLANEGGELMEAAINGEGIGRHENLDEIGYRIQMFRDAAAECRALRAAKPGDAGEASA